MYATRSLKPITFKRLITGSMILSLLFYWVLAASVAADKKLDITEVYQNPLSNGFGEDIKWVKWEDAVETALEVNKPIFLLMHKTWCHACRSLKKSMQQSNARKAFTRLSQYFVMVNTADDDEPYEEEYRPDGKYIPRLLFLDKNGDALYQFKNKKAEYKNYAYYYSSPADILNSMKDVLNHFGIDVPELKKGDKLKPKKPPAKTTAKKNDAPEGPEVKTAKKPDAGESAPQPEVGVEQKPIETKTKTTNAEETKKADKKAEKEKSNEKKKKKNPADKKKEEL